MLRKCAPKGFFLRNDLYADDHLGVNQFFKVGNLNILDVDSSYYPAVWQRRISIQWLVHSHHGRNKWEKQLYQATTSRATSNKKQCSQTTTQCKQQQASQTCSSTAAKNQSLKIMRWAVVIRGGIACGKDKLPSCSLVYSILDKVYHLVFLAADWNCWNIWYLR